MSDVIYDYDKVLSKFEPDSFDKKMVLAFTKQAKVFKWYNSDYVFRSGISWLKSLEITQGDEIIYGMGIDHSIGFMIFAFENGKIAKINMLAYETKTERKQLLNAFNVESALIFMKHFKEEQNIVITGSTGKTLIINTSIIHARDTKSSQGVQILKLKPSTYASSVLLMDDVEIQDISYYKRDSAAVGYYLKTGDRLEKKELINF